MAKLTAPLLSGTARGTIAGSLTFSTYKGLKVAKSIPTHPDALTLAQAYQRFNFRDAVDFWMTLTPAQRAAYSAPGARRHLTAMQEFIRQYLATNAYLDAAWTFDDWPGGVVTDRSRYHHPMTITNMTSIPGRISTATQKNLATSKYSAAHHDAFNQATNDFTISFWLNSVAAWDGPYHYSGPPYYGWALRLGNPTFLIVQLNLCAGTSTYRNLNAGELITTATWRHIAVVVKRATNAELWLDGTLRDAQDISAIVGSIATIAPLESKLDASIMPKAIDDLRLYSKPLAAAHIAHLATQRWPA